MKLPNGVKFCRGTLHFYQDADDMQTKGDAQNLKIEIANAGAGPYLVLSTHRWAIDDAAGIERLCKTVHDIASQLDKAGLQQQ